MFGVWLRTGVAVSKHFFAIEKRWLCLLISLFKLWTNNPSEWLLCILMKLQIQWNLCERKQKAKTSHVGGWAIRLEFLTGAWQTVPSWRFCWKSPWNSLQKEVAVSSQHVSRIEHGRAIWRIFKAEVDVCMLHLLVYLTPNPGLYCQGLPWAFRLFSFKTNYWTVAPCKLQSSILSEYVDPWL